MTRDTPPASSEAQTPELADQGNTDPRDTDQRAAATGASPSPTKRQRHPLTGDFMRRYGLLVAWAAIIVTFSILEPSRFATVGNFQAIISSQTVLVFLTLALIIPLTAGEFDISIAGVLTISIVLIGWLDVVHGWPIVLALLVVLAVGLVVGSVNAFMVVGIGVNSIVATLGMGTLLMGAALGVNSTTTGGISPALVDAVRSQVFGVPLGFYYGLILTAVVWYVFAYTPVGRYLFFVGTGRDVARLSGIRVDRIRAGAFVASAMISALAGVMLAGRLGAADPNVGASFLLPTFAAAFLGATAITPGRFNPWGSFIAVYFLVTGITGLQLLGLAGWIEQVFYGASLMIAVAFSHLAARGLAAR